MQSCFLKVPAPKEGQPASDHCGNIIPRILASVWDSSKGHPISEHPAVLAEAPDVQLLSLLNLRYFRCVVIERVLQRTSCTKMSESVS